MRRTCRRFFPDVRDAASRFLGPILTVGDMGGRGVITPHHNIERVRARREQNPEIDLCRHLKRHLQDRISERQKEELAQQLDTFVRGLARKCCWLQPADIDDLCQDVLCKLLSGGLRQSRQLRLIANDPERAPQLSVYLRTMMRARLKAAEASLCRQRQRAKLVPIDDAPSAALIEEKGNRPLPCLGDVMEALKAPSSSRQKRKDRHLVRALFAHGGDHARVAADHGVSTRTVGRALARIRNDLKAAFTIE